MDDLDDLLRRTDALDEFLSQALLADVLHKVLDDLEVDVGLQKGKTHLAQAYGRECCMRGLKTYYIKATELRDRFQKAVQRGNTSRVVSSLVKPSCLIVDEVGRCVYDRPCTDLFFDVVDRRYEKEGPNAMVLTSNIAPSGWDEFFTGDDTLLCALDRLFDKASVFVMRGPSYRGRGLDTYSVEAVPQAVKVRGIQPEGM